MIRRDKPLMGTKFVPSIGNIEGCYKYGGAWDRIAKICYEHHVPEHFPRDEGYTGCTAPIKGISVCWGTHLRDGIKFIDHVLSLTGDIVHSESMKVGHGESAKSNAEKDYFYIKESGNKKLFKEEKFVCINPIGKIIDCDKPNAIFTNKGKNITAITHSLRGHRKQRPLANIKPREYTPVDLEYKKGHQMEIVHLSDDLPVLMRKYRDKNNDRDYFPADAKKSLHPPLNKMEVPSIESIRHCFNNGGYWNGFWSVCIRNGCVGPHKGIECHYGAIETDDMRIVPVKEPYNEEPYDEEAYDEEWDTRYEPTVWCKITGKQRPDENFWNEERLVWDSSYNGYFSDYWRPDENDGYHFPDDYDIAEKAAKNVAIDMMNSIIRGSNDCFTPEGRKVKHTNPRAICGPREKVIKIYGEKHDKKT